jgi:cell division protein FtsL
MTKRTIAALLFATIMTCSFVWVRLQIVNISYDIHQLTKQEHDLREECNNLSLSINEAKSPQKLERLATARFGMQRPRAEQLITLKM